MTAPKGIGFDAGHTDEKKNRREDADAGTAEGIEPPTDEVVYGLLCTAIHDRTQWHRI